MVKAKEEKMKLNLTINWFVLHTIYKMDCDFDPNFWYKFAAQKIHFNHDLGQFFR